MNRKLIHAIILSFMPFMAYAQRADSLQVNDSLNSHTLSEVVVTSNRIGTMRLKTPEAIRVISIKSVEKSQPRTAPEALMLTPGVFVQKTNHGGGSPFIRGLTGNQTLLLIDGIRLSNATFRYGPNQYFNTIDVFGIEKLEVMRGSGSVQYGSDALGGTIQVLTHELKASTKPELNSSLQARTGSGNMEQSLHGNFGYSNQKFAFRAGITGRRFGNIVGGDTTGRQIPTGYREFDYDLKGKIFLSSSSDLTIAHQSVLQNDVPVYHKIVLENYEMNRMDPQKRKLSYLRFNKKFSQGIISSVRFTASLQNSIEKRESRKNSSLLLRSEEDKVRSAGFSAEAYLMKGKVWSANNGIELYSDLVRSLRFDEDAGNSSRTYMRGLYPDGSTMSSVSFFSMHSFELPHWILAAGARYNTFINRVDDENTGSTKLTPDAIVGSISLLRKLNGNSNLFASFNSGFRAPNIDDLGTLGIVDFRYEIPNLDLRPETSLNSQVGYKYQDKLIRGEVYLYRNELYDLITRRRLGAETIEGYPVYMKENTGRAYISGTEASFDLEAGKWMISGDLAYTFGHNLTSDEPMRRIPPLFGRISLGYRYDDLQLNAGWQAAGIQTRLAQGDRDDNRIPDGGTPGWNIFNIGGSYSFRFARIDLSILNILNRDYRYHGSGINGYGRSAFLSVAIDL